MFILSKVADLVQIAPHDFSKNSMDAIEDNINTKYANKVIQKIGLCICLWDVLWSSEGLIGHGTGLVNVNVEFRLVVFRPFKGEVLLGRITSGTQDGINIRTDFFDDIFVPFTELPDEATYEPKDALWVWRDEDQVMYYDIHEMVRFQVVSEDWHDQTPTGPLGVGDEPEGRTIAPYRITASMKGSGLGCCLWWDE
ncbi:RNA polymerase III subunit Rpc25-domain-containing protein [Phialemonium atrogriseum]|uniref:DNA-directed RNA polymerase subunit n=1 Tax=Phialemonium atrogriseum TaxID=1093897 RepID=A0AAJ0BWU2_9PEZI|nr:RNA polymerase III subunit Rpc25-domain-containing protein [Phialemonium atrogriseum]KAK1764569.1 RNA polymerase III subunit Rpc25-domain-containing protein [Phialemonium atrogriseum]